MSDIYTTIVHSISVVTNRDPGDENSIVRKVDSQQHFSPFLDEAVRPYSQTPKEGVVKVQVSLPFSSSAELELIDQFLAKWLAKTGQTTQRSASSVLARPIKAQSDLRNRSMKEGMESAVKSFSAVARQEDCEDLRTDLVTDQESSFRQVFEAALARAGKKLVWQPLEQMSAEEESKQLGNYLRELRMKAGYSRKIFAQMCGITQANLAQIEYGYVPWEEVDSALWTKILSHVDAVIEEVKPD